MLDAGKNEVPAFDPPYADAVYAGVDAGVVPHGAPPRAIRLPATTTRAASVPTR